MAQQTARKSALTEMAEEIFNLSTVAWLMRQHGKSVGRWDLSESEFLTLDLLARNGSMNVGHIQRQIGVLPAQMSRIVRALESKFDQPLIVCAINPDDKRRIDVSLSEAGRQAYQEFREARLSQTIEVLGQISDQDLDDFMRVIREIRKSLVKSVKPGD
jgi:DNA-binding MarR family transcriptional regulator